MLHFIQTLSLSAVLASGTMLCGQNAMACGGGACGQRTACAGPSCAAPAMPAGNAAPTEMQMDHSGHVQAGSRIRYQSAYQAPQYSPVQQYRAPSRNDFQYRADRKIRGL